jgi:hypothetical protein
MWRAHSCVRHGFNTTVYLLSSDSHRMACHITAMKYPVALMQTEEGYSVSCPGLPVLKLCRTFRMRFANTSKSPDNCATRGSRADEGVRPTSVTSKLF